MPWVVRMVLRFAPFVLLAQLYLAWRLWRSLVQLQPGWRSYRWLALPVLAWLNALPLVFLIGYALDGGYPLDNLRLIWADYLLVFPYWWGLIAAAECLPYFLLLEFGRLVFRFIPRRDPTALRRSFAVAHLVVALLVGGYVAIRIVHDTYSITLEEVTAAIYELPPELAGIRLILLGDIQVDRYTQAAKLDQAAAILNDEPGDMMLFAGDLVTDGTAFIPQGVDLLCRLHAPAGRFACMGDHDWWSGPEQIAAGLTDCGWHFLEDRHHVQVVNGRRVLVTGVTYIYSRRARRADVERLFAAAPPADLKIVLVHQPAPLVKELALKHGYHLMLAGHTHGGQVVFRPFGLPLTLSQFENRHYSGMEDYHGLPVVVTDGIGLTLAPVRYHSRAKMTRITLQGRAH
ncbi:MAG: metallophosphoesterase [Acidobacteria bacterium]|nr:metallophosphoesterase [Acidobacteriota bacterium]